MTQDEYREYKRIEREEEEERESERLIKNQEDYKKQLARFYKNSGMNRFEGAEVLMVDGTVIPAWGKYAVKPVITSAPVEPVAPVVPVVPVAPVTQPRTQSRPVAGTAITGSPEQMAIWEWMKDWRNGHAIVEAVAGSGKTTTIVHGVARMRRNVPILSLCFNAHTDKVMQGKLGAVGAGDVHRRTYNGMGASVLYKHYPKMVLRKNKLVWHIREIMGESAKWDTRIWLQRASELAKAYYVDRGDDTAMEAILRSHKLKVPTTKKAYRNRMDNLWAVLDAVLADTEGCDYDDQIWMPLKLGLRFPQYRLVLVDEYQDTNAMQWRLVEKVIGDNGRVLVVGDRNQACYGFRGADINASDNIEIALRLSDKPVAIFPLSVTRRCTQAQVRAAQILVPAIEALPYAPEGMIGTKSIESFEAEVKPGHLVMCRVNAPMIERALALMSKGVRVAVRGRDVGKNITALIDSLRPIDIRDLATVAEQWYKTQKANLNFLTQQEEMQSLEDRYRTLVVLMAGCVSLAALSERIEDLFTEFEADGAPKNAVVFGSIHRAKGLEAPVCWILSPELIPHPKAEQAWELEQEHNLAYIAITRAQFDLADPENTGQTWFVNGAVPLIYGSTYLNRPKRGV